MRLCPAQKDARESLADAVKFSNVVALWGRAGCGKTTILADLHAQIGGARLTTADFVDAMAAGSEPMRLEETFYTLVKTALQAHRIVIFDDLDSINAVVGGSCHFYPRSGFFDAPIESLCELAIREDKRLIIGCGSNLPDPLLSRAYSWGVAKFTVQDYACLLDNYLGRRLLDRLDVQKIHRFAPKLNGYQIRNSCEWLKRDGHLDTERFLEYLRSQSLGSNVELSEVQEVDLHDLKGIDDLIEALEASIIVPLENSALAEELDIKPKRGVLLAGPPGTGKTTVGRALAHRLRSKFFLIDGTFISGTRDFYQKVHYVFEAAKNNAPSIIFIDDSDVIFESGEEMGLYRYLLTMLDGLESESAGRVCVMLTAMDVGNLPPALVRSGRVELWLETRLPDEVARRSILNGAALKLPAAIGPIDMDQLVEASQELTGADLKRVIEDGKLLYGYDRSKQRPKRDATEYFLQAIETVRENKERYARAEAIARSKRPDRPPWFDMMQGAMFAASGAYAEDDDE
jgi:ATP-dependent 26S proteasome regulatory subunit